MCIWKSSPGDSVPLTGWQVLLEVGKAGVLGFPIMHCQSEGAKTGVLRAAHWGHMLQGAFNGSRKRFKAPVCKTCPPLRDQSGTSWEWRHRQASRLLKLPLEGLREGLWFAHASVWMGDNIRGQSPLGVSSMCFPGIPTRLQMPLRDLVQVRPQVEVGLSKEDGHQSRQGPL